MAAYTGIGSRKTPDEVLYLMEDTAFRLAEIGFVLRSGKAAGADAAFQKGLQRFSSTWGSGSTHRLAEIYVPWKGFKGGEGLASSWDMSLEDIDKEFPQHSEMRWDWVKEVHGGWDKLTQGARKLHERNIHQLFGRNLGDAYLNQSKFVIYYAEDTRAGNPKGGTATAVNLAKKQGIRTLNLLHENNRVILEKFLCDLEAKYGSRV